MTSGKLEHYLQAFRDDPCAIQLIQSVKSSWKPGDQFEECRWTEPQIESCLRRLKRYEKVLHLQKKLENGQPKLVSQLQRAFWPFLLFVILYSFIPTILLQVKINGTTPFNAGVLPFIGYSVTFFALKLLTPVINPSEENVEINFGWKENLTIWACTFVDVFGLVIYFISFDIASSSLIVQGFTLTQNSLLSIWNGLINQHMSHQIVALILTQMLICVCVVITSGSFKVSDLIALGYPIIKSLSAKLIEITVIPIYKKHDVPTMQRANIIVGFTICNSVFLIPLMYLIKGGTVFDLQLFQSIKGLWFILLILCFAFAGVGIYWMMSIPGTSNLVTFGRTTCMIMGLYLLQLIPWDFELVPTLLFTAMCILALCMSWNAETEQWHREHMEYVENLQEIKKHSNLALKTLMSQDSLIYNSLLSLDDDDIFEISLSWEGSRSETSGHDS